MTQEEFITRGVRGADEQVFSTLSLSVGFDFVYLCYNGDIYFLSDIMIILIFLFFFLHSWLLGLV